MSTMRHQCPNSVNDPRLTSRHVSIHSRAPELFDHKGFEKIRSMAHGQTALPKQALLILITMPKIFLAGNASRDGQPHMHTRIYWWPNSEQKGDSYMCGCSTSESTSQNTSCFHSLYSVDRTPAWNHWCPMEVLARLLCGYHWSSKTMHHPNPENWDV